MMRAHSVEEAQQMLNKSIAEGKKIIVDLSDINIDELDELFEPISFKKKKPSRNDYCPCGSGLKYKKCCLPH
jgi:uncharacterized protein YecA (UPF0149 family)